MGQRVSSWVYALPQYCYRAFLGFTLGNQISSEERIQNGLHSVHFLDDESFAKSDSQFQSSWEVSILKAEAAT